MLASLDHPGIVKVLRSFEGLGTAYFVMPFVDGLALDELSKQRDGTSFSEDELCGLLERMLSALGYLHDRGIYHRDIKPGNLLITHGGIPVLIDFGSARQRLSERSMTVVESAGYTPFEQLQSRGNVGPWSDLYALGGTLVKVITGETPPKAMDRMRKDPYQALAERKDLQEVYDNGFLNTIDHALAVDEDARWQDVKPWLMALFRETVPESASPKEGNFRSAAKSARGESSVEEVVIEIAPRASITFCWIPPGEFMMGSRSNDQKRHGTPSQCKVEISKGFWLAKTAVTQALWHAVMGRNPSHFIGEVLPVENVSWNDACEFLKKSNEIDIVGWKMVLPTEAQWEFACRAGESMQSYGRTLNDIAWYDANSGGRPQPAGEKRPNERGLHDMRGNIWEWCADWYGANLSGGTDPRGAFSGISRVYRGGSWFSHAENCHAAYRNAGVPSFRSNNLGFRPALVSSE